MPKKKMSFWFEGGEKPDLEIAGAEPASSEPFRIQMNIRFPQARTAPMPISVEQTDDKLIVTAALQGYRKEDISVRVTSSMLEIRVKKSSERVVQAKGVYKAERSSGEVSRAMSLPVPIDTTGVKSTFKDGVLEIVMKKLKKRL